MKKIFILLLIIMILIFVPTILYLYFKPISIKPNNPEILHIPTHGGQ